MSPFNCFCGRTYSNPIDLEEHRLARGHFPSHHCKESCRHPSATPQDGRSHICNGCGKLCERSDILKDHLIVTGHCYCSGCDLTFPTENDLIAHRKSGLHVSEFKCCDCGRSFRDTHSLSAHMESPIHTKSNKQKTTPKTTPKTKKGSDVVTEKVQCKKCHKTFSDSKSLQLHTNSVKHKPLSNLSCPIGKGCRGKFTSPSALLHHLESGKCQSGMNKEGIYQMVRSCDTEGVIHSRPALTSSASSSSVIYTPSLSSETSMISSGTESEWSLLTPTPSEGGMEDSLEQWSLLGDSQIPFYGSLSIDATSLPTLHCPFCPKARKRFSNALALQQHMDSPVHSAKVYHCPINLFVTSSKKGEGKKKKKHFSTLSGLSQHLESGACRGGKKAFLQCIGLIQGHFEQLGLGGVRVLLPAA